MEKIAKLTLGDKTYELPTITGTENETGLDITQLRAQSGLITFDPAFANTGAFVCSLIWAVTRNQTSPSPRNPIRHPQ